MVFPETIPTNTQEGAEREAPAFESGEQPISPEEQVEQAMEAVEAAKKEFDPAKADAEMASDQREYAERLSASPESIAKADEAIAGDLSAIKAEEAGLLEKLNAKLRKYVGVAGLAAATAGPAAAMENPGGGLQLETDDHTTVEVIPNEAFSNPDIPRTLQSDKGSSDMTEEDAERKLPEEILKNQAQADESLARGEVRVVSAEEIEKEMKRERESAEEDSFAREFRERNFSDESEVFAYLHEGALRFGKEFATIYGVRRGGGVVKAVGEFGDASSTFILDADDIMRKLRESDVEKVRFAHTHPIRTMERVLTEEYIEELRKEGNSLSHMPPSLVDIRSASTMHWQDLYDNPKYRSEEWWNAAETENVVIDGGGMWKYRVDHYHPYVVKQREAAIREVLDSKEREGKHIDREESRSSLESLSGADPLVLKRAIRHLPKELNVFDVISARSGGSVGKFADGDQYEYTKEQLDVMSAPPEKNSEAIARYIDYCRQRGIEISYTPFQPGE